METHLYQSLIFLACATGLMIVLVGIMLVKVLCDLSKLTQNLNETTKIVNTELLPTLKNVNKSVEIVSNFVIKTDENISRVKNFIAKSPLGLVKKFTSATGSAAKGFFSGLSAALKLFCKK